MLMVSFLTLTAAAVMANRIYRYIDEEDDNDEYIVGLFGVCVCVCACVRACVRARVRARVRACVHMSIVCVFVSHACCNTSKCSLRRAYV